MFGRILSKDYRSILCRITYHAQFYCSIEDPDEWLKRLRLLLWGYTDLKRMLGDDTGGLVDIRKRMVEAGADSGYTEYLLASHEDEPDLENLPLQVYYRPGPTVTHCHNYKNGLILMRDIARYLN